VGPDPTLIAEMKAHTAGLTTLVGVMGTIIGICIGALATIAWRRLNKIEQRQEDLRDKTLPQLLTKADMEAVVTALKEVGMAFVDRVECFMEACRDGKCATARMMVMVQKQSSQEDS